MNRVEIEEWFQSLIHVTRDCLETEAEDAIPKVSLGDVLPDFWDEWFNPVLEAWTPQVRHDLCRFFLNQMKLHPHDVAIRYTALAVYDGLIQYQREHQVLLGGVPRGITTWENHDALLREDFKSVLHSLNIRDLMHWREIRWEISNSCLMEDWDRALSGYGRARELGVLRDADLRLLLGQFHFLLAFRETPVAPLQGDILRDNGNFLPGFGNFLPGVLHPFNWEPQPYDSPDSVSSLLLFASGLIVSTGGLDDPRLDRQILLEAIDALEKARELRQLPPPNQAALARCYFSVGRFHDAAAQYSRLLEEELSGAWSRLTSHVYRAVAESYVSAQEPVKAIKTLELCSSKFSKETDVYFRTAELQAQQTDYPAVRETIRKGADNLPGLDEDWRLSSLLALGSVRATPREILESIRVDPRLKDGISALLRDYWPPFEKLSNSAKNEWVKGTYLYSFPEEGMAGIFTSSALLGFIKGLDAELAQRVFVPAREHFRTDKQLYDLVSKQREQDPKSDSSQFCKFVCRSRWNLGIGEKSRILTACQRPTTPEVLTRLRTWLHQDFTDLLAQTELLQRVSKFRNAAEHEDRSTETSDYISNACRTLIETLL